MTGITIKILSAICAVLIALFSLCFTTAEETQAQDVLTLLEDIPLPGQGSDGELITLRLFSSQGEASQSLQQAADMFCADRPDILIQIHTIGSRSDYRSSLRSKLLSGEQVDLFHIFGYAEVQELEGYIADLSHLEWLDEARGNSLGGVSTEDGVYGVPYSLDGYGLLFNTDIWDQAGIDISAIATFEDLEEAFEELRVQIRDNQLLEAFPELEAVTEFPALDTDFLGNDLGNIAFYEDFSTPAATLSTRSFAFSGSGEIKEYIDLMTRCSSDRGDVSRLGLVSRTQQVQTGLAAGRVAVIQESIEAYRDIQAINPQISDALVLRAIPLPGMETGYVYADAPVYWAVNNAASPQVQQAATDFLQWLYTSPQGAYLVQNGLGVLSPFPTDMDENLNRLQRKLLSYMDNGHARGWVYREFPGEFGTQVFAAGVRDYLDDKSTWNDFTVHCQERWYHLR